MIIKYQRTSTTSQEGNRFQLDTDSYDCIYFDRGVSGLIPFDQRTEAKKIIKLIEAKKVKNIVVEELRDIARDISGTINILKYFEDNGVCVTIKAFSLHSHVDGKKNELWNLVTGIMSSLYSMELENLRTRTRNGLIAYQLRGGKLGRKIGTHENESKFLAKPKNIEISRFLKMGKSVRDIAGRLNVSTATVQKVRNIVNKRTMCVE